MCSRRVVVSLCMLLQDYYKKYGKESAKKKLRSISRAVYMNSSKPKQCAVCAYSKHIEVHHIKPLCHFNSHDPISGIYDIDNLEALCPNCHANLHRRDC